MGWQSLFQALTVSPLDLLLHSTTSWIPLLQIPAPCLSETYTDIKMSYILKPWSQTRLCRCGPREAWLSHLRSDADFHGSLRALFAVDTDEVTGFSWWGGGGNARWRLKAWLSEEKGSCCLQEAKTNDLCFLGRGKLPLHVMYGKPFQVQSCLFRLQTKRAIR